MATSWICFLPLVTFNAVLFLFVMANSDFCGSVFENQIGYVLYGHVMETATVADEFECQLKCLANNSCKSFNVHPDAGNNANRICELNNKTRQMKPGDFKQKKGSNYFGSVQVSCMDTVQDHTKQTKRGHCHPGYSGKQCLPTKGWHRNYPGHSCKDIRDSTDSSKEGEYWIDPEDKGNPLKVYCDMTTDGGGWLLVFNFVIGSSTPSQLSFVTSYREISGYHSNNMVITTSAMNELLTHMPYTQLRFHCSKQQGRTFHVATAANSTGNAVVQYFNGQTNVVPNSCNSFVRMEDDDSMLAAVCHDWGDNWAGKWGGAVPTEERLSSHPAWVIAAYHWLLLPDIPRIECDDYLGGVSPGDFWKVFVR